MGAIPPPDNQPKEGTAMTFSELVAQNAHYYNNDETPTTDKDWRHVWYVALSQFNNSDFPVVVANPEFLTPIMAAALTNAVIDEYCQAVCVGSYEDALEVPAHVSPGQSWAHIAMTMVALVLRILD
jgi:hypothetical protein